MVAQRVGWEPNVMLRGGPAAWSDEVRLQTVLNPEEKLKVLNGNRYEHFEPTGETVRHAGLLLRVYLWRRCTYVAE